MAALIRGRCLCRNKRKTKACWTHPHQMLILIGLLSQSGQFKQTVEGKRKREIGLVVPGKFVCCTKQLRQANILYRELMEKKTKYSHFEINKISFDKKKWPSIGLE